MLPNDKIKFLCLSMRDKRCFLNSRTKRRMQAANLKRRPNKDGSMAHKPLYVKSRGKPMAAYKVPRGQTRARSEGLLHRPM
jgi:hypothetical protein